MLSVSKWIKTQVLLDEDEIEGLPSFHLYNSSTIEPFEKLKISREAFLDEYRRYISDLKAGKIPNPDRKIFSSVATIHEEAVHAKEIDTGRFKIQLMQPAVQLQHHRFLISEQDFKIHSMVMSPDSISWGLQFAFPQIYFDGKKYGKTQDLPNAKLFNTMMKWVRGISDPVTFIFKDHKITSSIRLGKNCFAWIQKHPQLKAQGIGVHVY